MIQVKWGVEVVWCLVTPKNISHDSKIQHIACASIYSKPNSKNKTDLLDHISEAYNLLCSKYGRGLHFCLAGDTNDLKLDSILNLSPSFVQIVKKPTRRDTSTGEETLLDPIIMTLSNFYQEPLYLCPLDADVNKKGTKSDHRIPLVRPINTINNKSVRTTRHIVTRPITSSGLDKMKEWLTNESWQNVFSCQSAHEKAFVFQTSLLEKFYLFFPEKTRKISSDDQPWITEKLKKLDRRRKRIYHKHRKSDKWLYFDKLFKKEMKSAKSNFYKNMISDLRFKKPAQWYSSLKL